MALDFFAGCVGGCAGILVGHPLDTIKIRIQTQNWQNPQFKGTIDCFRTIIRQESVWGLYKGMSSPLVGVAFINAIVFGVYGNIHRKIIEPESLKSHFVAGSIAGVVQSFVCSPVELVKSRMQLQTNQTSNGPFSILRAIRKTEGFTGIFKGLNITFLREGIAFGVYFSTYEYLTSTEDSKSIGTAHLLAAGGTSGAASWLLTYPLDVIKSRIQTDGMFGEKKYKNSLDCLVKTFKADGLSSLFRGLNPTLIRAFPTNAATWAAVTWVLKIFQTESNNQNQTADNKTQTIDTKILHDFPTKKIYTYDFCFNKFYLQYLIDEST